MSEAPEFSRPLPAERAAAQPYVTDIAATAEECAALALRMQVPAIAQLACHFRLTAGEGGSIAVEGRLHARLTRICVVSLDPFETELQEDFRVRFVPVGHESEDDDPDSDDEIAYEGASIDLGEAAAEQLALCLDPYPRAPGAELPDLPGEGESGPFAALARLRRPQ